MSRIQTLQVLLEREQARRDEIRSMLQAAQRQAEAAQAQSQALGEYRADYGRRWSGQFALSGSVEILRCYQGFMERLDHAISHQSQQVQAIDANLKRVRERLLAQETRVATVERLIERQREHLRQVQDRRDQKSLDEMAMRRRLPPGLSSGMVRAA